jgi:hypothetical protein
VLVPFTVAHQPDAGEEGNGRGGGDGLEDEGGLAGKVVPVNGGDPDLKEARHLGDGRRLRVSVVAQGQPPGAGVDDQHGGGDGERRLALGVEQLDQFAQFRGRDRYRAFDRLISEEDAAGEVLARVVGEQAVLGRDEVDRGLPQV